MMINKTISRSNVLSTFAKFPTIYRWDGSLRRFPWLGTGIILPEHGDFTSKQAAAVVGVALMRRM
ncbi:hypothetical protein [Photobacterium sp. TY1-4]|uniref:hypothetical protein n=1 Tax=Photobacterium sp. TY1-4 TaxID=2899122 RepID=UPI0021BEE16E|nr:hypothetical protein [Photobacterium sp. TY1-4]UXI03439.1 hypothetical protein NH461_23735 [Photobacterium sp. TY1-4]